MARFQGNGSRAEKDIDLVIEVEDINDCAPVFSFEVTQNTGEVYEASTTGIYFISQI